MSEVGQPSDASSEATEAKVLHMGGVTVEMGPESERHEFTTGAIGFTDVTVTDLWHLSEREIDRFEDEKGTDEVSKHGPGTYVGGGDLGGTQIGAIRLSDHNRYELKFSGNVLMVPFPEYDDTAWELEEILANNGIELPGHNPGRMINTALRNNEINGVSYDAFLLYANATGEGRDITEGVIFYPEKTLEIVGHEVIARTK